MRMTDEDIRKLAEGPRMTHAERAMAGMDVMEGIIVEMAKEILEAREPPALAVHVHSQACVPVDSLDGLACGGVEQRLQRIEANQRQLMKALRARPIGAGQ